MREEPRPSARVRLEVAFLDDSDTRPREDTTDDERTRLTALIVAAEADVRRYVGECLRGRAGVRICEASNTEAATALMRSTRPDFAIVEQSSGPGDLSHLPTIVLVDDVPYGAATVTPRIRLLNRPFSAEELMREVDQLLREEP